MGWYADSINKAREDVTVALLCRVLAYARKKICNFNYHNVVLLEQVAILQAENFDLIMENATLKEQLRELGEERSHKRLP